MAAAAGAMEYMDLLRVTNVARALQSLKDAGYWTAALTAEGDQVLWDADFRGSIALVIGNEGKEKVLQKLKNTSYMTWGEKKLR